MREVSLSNTETDHDVDVLSGGSSSLEGTSAAATARLPFRTLGAMLSLPRLDALSPRLPPKDVAHAQLPALASMLQAPPGEAVQMPASSALLVRPTAPADSGSGSSGPASARASGASAAAETGGQGSSSSSISASRSAGSSSASSSSGSSASSAGAEVLGATAQASSSSSRYLAVGEAATWDGSTQADQKWLVSRCIDAGKAYALYKFSRPDAPPRPSTLVG